MVTGKKEPMFPVLGDPIIKALPWSFLMPHEKQAQQNHGQNLKQLAGRGGLGIDEVYHIIRDERYPFATHNMGRVRWAVMQRLSKFQDAADLDAGGKEGV